MTNDPTQLNISGVSIAPGEQKYIEIKIAKLYDYTEMIMPVKIIRGLKPGPVMFVSAAMHGDEINGVEICRRLLKNKLLKKISGTLIVVPIVNIFGFNNKTRYLPDRRDLNRSFPGSEKGSLAARLAHIFLTEIVAKCSHGIDLHTGVIHRSNLPHIRACIDNPAVLELAHAFSTPVILNSNIQDGSLRDITRDRALVLLYEGGEALRFDPTVIKAGLHGIIAVMQKIGMLNSIKQKTKKTKQSFIAKSSYWIRAAESGILSSTKKLGAQIKANEIIAEISDPFARHVTQIKAEAAGIIIGQTQIPLVNEGDAIFHVASFENIQEVHKRVELYEEYIDMATLDPSTLF